MNYIRHIVEPRKILLAWQTAAGTGKKRRIVAEIIKENNDIRLEYLTHTNDFNEALALGFSRYPGLPVRDKIHSNVMDVFSKRLPPRTRNDFNKYLNSLRIPDDIELSNFALLGYSGARLPDDDFVFIHPFDTAKAPFEFLMLIPDFSYDRTCRLTVKEGTPVIFEKEGNSSAVPGIKIMSEDKKIGHVDPVLLPRFHKWIDGGLSISPVIERVNGSKDKMKIYLFVSVT